ncbi:MAG: hypothetical protein IJK87_11285 [Prevotella sp.]|nr:hypothetical protein [Prevotella sp.]
MIERQRKIAIKDYYGIGQHIYEDELGFSYRDLQEARTLGTREAFRFHVECVGLNLAFYYPATDTFYGIHTETIPIRVKILPRHREWSDFIGWQCDSDTHDEGEVIAVFNSASEIWDNLRIDGKPFEEVLRDSYITALN